MNIEKYEYTIQYSEEDNKYIAKVTEFPYLSADGGTPSEAFAEIVTVVNGAVEILSSEGREAPVPISEREYRGNISLRLSPETHRLAIARARVEGCSLNQFLTSIIERNLYASAVETAAAKLNLALTLLDNRLQNPVVSRQEFAGTTYSGIASGSGFFKIRCQSEFPMVNATTEAKRMLDELTQGASECR